MPEQGCGRLARRCALAVPSRGHRPLRGLAALAGALIAAALGWPGGAIAAPASGGEQRQQTRTTASAQQRLAATLRREMKRAGPSSGALVVDLNTGAMLFSLRASTPRLPASVQKLYTTATALLDFGPAGRLTTSLYATGHAVGTTWVGTLYLRGGGDPSFGSAAFDRLAYGGGATMQQLVANLLAQTGIRRVQGALDGDGSYLDSVRGTPATGGAANLYVEGQLSGLAYDRGFTSAAESAFQPRPWLFAARALASSLRAAGVLLPKHLQIHARRTPPQARLLAAVQSPPMATLVRWTNTPSDNFFAEMLLKDLGARFGAGGTTAAGAALVRAQIAQRFGIRPTFDDGSGLSYADHTSPLQVVTLL